MSMSSSLHCIVNVLLIENKLCLEKWMRLKSDLSIESDLSMLEWMILTAEEYVEATRRNCKGALSNISINVKSPDVVTKDSLHQRREHLKSHNSQHETSSLKTEKFSCEVCSRTFAGKTSHKCHKSTHKEDGSSKGRKPIVCSECDQTFSRWSDLRRHQTRTHRPGAATSAAGYVCEVCGVAFRHPTSFAAHRRAAHGGTDSNVHKCKDCSAEFVYQRHLVDHQRIHTNERPYKCEYCGKAFRQSGTLGKHRRIHTNARPYTCHVCTKTFRYKSVLSEHEKIHSGEKPFECDICGKRFVQKTTLTRHRKTHDTSPSKGNLRHPPITLATEDPSTVRTSARDSHHPSTTSSMNLFTPAMALNDAHIATDGPSSSRFETAFKNRFNKASRDEGSICELSSVYSTPSSRVARRAASVDVISQRTSTVPSYQHSVSSVLHPVYVRPPTASTTYSTLASNYISFPDEFQSTDVTRERPGEKSPHPANPVVGEHLPVVAQRRTPWQSIPMTSGVADSPSLTPNVPPAPTTLPTSGAIYNPAGIYFYEQRNLQIRSDAPNLG